MTNPDIASKSLEQWTAEGMMVARFAGLQPERIAVKTAGGEMRSWRQLNERANQLARLFRANGLKAGDGVALLAHNSPEFVETWAACQRSGLRLTPINWHQSAQVIGYILDNCDAKALVASARFADVLNEVAGAAKSLSLKLAFAGDIPGFSNLDDRIASEDTSDIEAPTAGTYMLYTSGTTGRPKGVFRPTRPAVSQLTNTILETAAFNHETDVALVTGPLYHAAPLALNMITPINAGVTCILMDKWDAEETLRLVQDEHVTHTHVVPTMFHRLLQLPESVRSKYDLSSLRWILHGAAPCPPHVKQAMMDWLGPIIFEYYSSTEGGGVFIRPDEWLRKPGSVGRAVEGVGVKVTDSDGEISPAGETGTIYIRAPETGRFEYYKDPEKTKSSYRDDYFTLGDMGYFDEDGFLFLTGRSAELIISGGVNIYPVEIDEALIRHPAVADAAAVGAPNEEWGEEIKAIIELKQGERGDDATIASIMDFARNALPGFQRPRSIEFVDSIPRSAAGKVLRQVLRDRYWPAKAKT